jgi:hypothetical protein
MWNNLETGVQWLQFVGEYKGSASARGYVLAYDTVLSFIEKV